MPEPDVDSIRKRAEKAADEVGRIALNPARNFRMTIPANPDKDSDLILSDALKHIPALLDALATAREERQELFEAWQAGESTITQLRGELSRKDEALREMWRLPQQGQHHHDGPGDPGTCFVCAVEAIARAALSTVETPPEEES